MKATKINHVMTKLTTLFLVFLLFSLTTLTTSCKPEGPQGKNLICLVDFSSSKNRAERLAFYASMIENNIIPQMGINDKLSVFPIDDASVTNSSNIFITDLSKHDFLPEMASPLEEDQITQDSLNKFKNRLLIDFAKSFDTAISNRTESSMGSDIFGALEVAKTNLESGKKENIIILLSDMMNWSKTLKMEPQDRQFSSKTIDESLSKAPGIDFSGTSILVLTGEQTDVNAEHFNLVKDFWKSYFESNNATLIDYSSASQTKLQELMN